MKHQSNTLRYGLKMFAGIGLFFILTNLLGLGKITELRAVNLVIILYFTSRLALENIIDDDKVNYLSNLSSLFAANILNIILSLIALVIYVKLIDVEYLQVLINDSLFAQVNSLTEICIVLAAEGVAGGAVVSFGVMQYWKNHKRSRKPVVFNE